LIGCSHYTTTTFTLVLETLTPPAAAAADWHTPPHGLKLLSWHVVWGTPLIAQDLLRQIEI